MRGGRSGKERIGERAARIRLWGEIRRQALVQQPPKGSYLQMGMAVETGKAIAHVYEDPRNPGPGKGCCGSGGSDGLPELN